MLVSQAKRLYDLLFDGCWHETPEILRIVYGSEHLGIARISARVHDIKKYSDVEAVESEPTERETVWKYRMVRKIKPVQMDLINV